MAKPFRFRLETLLALRRNERDAHRRSYAQSLEARRVLVEQREAIEEEIADVRTLTRSTSAPGTLDVDRLLRAHRYELLLTVRCQQLRQQEQQVAEEVERRRQALVAADREVKLLEKLKERQSDAYQRQEVLREQKEIDEIAQRYGGQWMDVG